MKNIIRVYLNWVDLLVRDVLHDLILRMTNIFRLITYG